jgi:hypothetical protein
MRQDRVVRGENTVKNPKVGSSSEENLEALAENIAMHCEETSILAGNKVCQELMRHASKIIRELLARNTGSDPAPADSCETESQLCRHCNSLKPYHDLDCPVAVAAMANAEQHSQEKLTLGTLNRYEVVSKQGSRMVTAPDGQWVAYREVESLVNAMQAVQDADEPDVSEGAPCSIDFGKGATLEPGPQDSFEDGLREAARLIQLWQSTGAVKEQIHSPYTRDVSRIVAFWPARLRELAEDGTPAGQGQASSNSGQLFVEWARQEGLMLPADSTGLAFVSDACRVARKAWEASAAQGQVFLPAGEVGAMPGALGFTMACFPVDKVPVGVTVYTLAAKGAAA